jgi:cell division protein FtsW
VALILYLADVFTRFSNEVRTFRFYVKRLAVVGLVFALILMEPDFGTAVLIGGVSFLVFFVAGVRLRHIAGSLCLALPLLVTLVVYYPYRVERILAFLNPWKYAKTIGYHVTQSLIGLGSGGFWGLGLGEGRQKLGYLPEPYGDFIFSVLGEELGLAGSLAVMGLFLLWAWSGMRIAKRARDPGGFHAACALTSLVGCQALFNIAVVTSSLPAKGISLPFVSFGGSSLLAAMTAVGILFNVSKQAGREDGIVPGREPEGSPVVVHYGTALQNSQWSVTSGQ